MFSNQLKDCVCGDALVQICGLVITNVFLTYSLLRDNLMYLEVDDGKSLDCLSTFSNLINGV